MDAPFKKELDEYNRYIGIFLLRYSQVDLLYTHFLARCYTFQKAKYYSLVSIFETWSLNQKYQHTLQLIESISTPPEIME
ncbi:unnamed protein product, partial [marine sediment metagenome]